MQQLDNMDIAGNQISVTIAPLSQAEAAAAAAAAATALDLDDAEGQPQSFLLLWGCLQVRFLFSRRACRECASCHARLSCLMAFVLGVQGSMGA